MATFCAIQKFIVLYFIHFRAAFGEIKLNIQHGNGNMCTSSSQSPRIEFGTGGQARHCGFAVGEQKEQDAQVLSGWSKLVPTCPQSNGGHIGPDHFIIHTDQDRSVHFVITHEPSQKLFITGNQAVDQKVAYALLLMNTGQPEQSVEQFTNIIKEHPWVAGAHFGRGTAYMRKGIQFKEFADGAINDFSAVIRLHPANPDGWIRRAEVYSPLGRLSEALSDINVALDLEPTSQLYLMSGTLHYMQQDYQGAQKKFEKCLELEKDQPTALLYLGMSFFHTGRIREAINAYLSVLKTGANIMEAHRNLGHAYRELGDVNSAKDHFTAALIIEPTNAKILSLRGSLNYLSGRPQEGLADFKACLSFSPHSTNCEYMKGLSYAALGNFFEAVKSSTKITLEVPSATGPDIIKASYLKEYSRYLHTRLDSPLSELKPDKDLDGRLREYWVKSLSFNIQNYSEQPGIQPHIRELDHPSFADFTLDAQMLLCKSHQLGPRIQYHADGFIPSIRSQRAMGLAILDVAQSAQRHWKAIRSTKNLTGVKKMSWREMFDVAVKWRRMVDPEHPVLWLHQLPDKSVKSGFSVRMNLIRGQTRNVRYAGYLDRILEFTKRMLINLYRVESLTTEDFLHELSKATSSHDLMRLLKADNPNNQRPGLMLSTHVPSLRSNAPILDGIMVLLSESGLVISNNDNKNLNVAFTLDIASTQARTTAYSTELEFIWNQLNKEVRRPGNKESEMSGTYVLSLAYYFINMMPLARGTSAVAYTVALGLFLAVGKEVTGHIPKGKQVDLEALIGGDPSSFARHLRNWLGLKKVSKPVSSLPSVSDTFYTVRMALEALNVKMTAEDCAESRSFRGRL